jgi:hypothetical protein
MRKTRGLSVKKTKKQKTKVRCRVRLHEKDKGFSSEKKMKK